MKLTLLALIMEAETDVGNHSLPIPDIREENLLEYSFKQNRRKEDTKKFLPPKVKRALHDSYCIKNNSQMYNTSSVHVISFRSNDSKLNELSELSGGMDVGADNTSTNTLELNLSSSYNPESNNTYFEQCFTHLTKLGEGSFGEVFKVRSKDNGLLYAIKMSKQLFRGEYYRQERLEEVKRYEQFTDHDNCVKFYCAWEENDRLYMQMELCRENLEQFLQRRGFIPETKIWSIMLDLLLALKSLHDKNLIHLDIKLDNVLISHDDTCKLADFGLVTDVDKANRHQATEGDSRYIAPEILRGEFSKAADIFSLGIAMLELACYLELPANGPLWQKLRNGILPEKFLKTASIELQEIILQMMDPDPVLRPTVDEILQHHKLIAVMKYRERWAILKKMRSKFREFNRMIWSFMCNLKDNYWRIFGQIRNSLLLPSKRKEMEKNADPTLGIKTSPLFASTPACRCRIRFLDEEYENLNICDDKLGSSDKPEYTTPNRKMNVNPQNDTCPHAHANYQNNQLHFRKNLFNKFQDSDDGNE